MSKKNKHNKFLFVSVGTGSSILAEYPDENKPESLEEILEFIINREWMIKRQNSRDVHPHQVTIELHLDKVIGVSFYSGRGAYAVFAQDLLFFTILADRINIPRDYTSELHFLVDWQIPELMFIATSQQNIQYYLPKIFTAIGLKNKQARVEKIKTIRSNILQNSSPIVVDLFKSKHSSYSIYSYHSLKPIYRFKL